MTVTLIPETRWTRAVSIPLPISREVGPYKNVIYRKGSWFYAQRSGHGQLCSLRVGRFEWWISCGHWLWRNA